MDEGLGGMVFLRLRVSEAANLEIPFSEVEIHATLKELNGDKALGPDGYMMTFWQSNWSKVKEDILSLFKDFHNSRKFVKSINTKFIVMIPKKRGSKKLKDCRLVSLRSSLYKVIKC